MFEFAGQFLNAFNPPAVRGRQLESDPADFDNGGRAEELPGPRRVELLEPQGCVLE